MLGFVVSPGDQPERGWTSGSSRWIVAGSVAFKERVGPRGVPVAEPSVDLGFFPSALQQAPWRQRAFFALLGGMFALTRYLQQHGQRDQRRNHEPDGVGADDGRWPRLLCHRARVGTRRRRGVDRLAILAAPTTVWTPDTNARAGRLVLRPGTGDGWAMAPATSLPERAGGGQFVAASASRSGHRRPTSRSAAAIIGSLIASLYSNDVGGSSTLDAWATTPTFRPAPPAHRPAAAEVLPARHHRRRPPSSTSLFRRRRASGDGGARDPLPPRPRVRRRGRRPTRPSRGARSPNRRPSDGSTVSARPGARIHGRPRARRH